MVLPKVLVATDPDNYYCQHHRDRCCSHLIACDRGSHCMSCLHYTSLDRPNLVASARHNIRMPKINGFQLYRELHKLDQKAKICFITAFEIYYDEFKKMFPKIRVNCFVRKPVSIEELRKIIREELELQEELELKKGN